MGLEGGGGGSAGGPKGYGFSSFGLKKNIDLANSVSNRVWLMLSSLELYLIKAYKHCL